jgi:hypothetical protein
MLDTPMKYMSDNSQEESSNSSQESGDSSPAQGAKPASETGKKNVNSAKILIGVGVFLIVVLIHPISNFFLNRSILGVEAGVPEFGKASVVMQNKCADCHSPGMMVEPIYYGYPYAGELIADDMRVAQKNMLISREHLTGQKKFTKKQLAKIENVIENNDMPPKAYKIMHWNAGLTAEDKEAMTNWLKAEFAAASGGK